MLIVKKLEFLGTESACPPSWGLLLQHSIPCYKILKEKKKKRTQIHKNNLADIQPKVRIIKVWDGFNSLGKGQRHTAG